MPPAVAFQSLKVDHATPRTMNDSPSSAPPLAELQSLERILEFGARQLALREDRVQDERHGCHWPIYTATLGCADPQAPAVGFFGGVHGLERIGAQLVMDHLHAVLTRLNWDGSLQALLEKVRLVFMPLVNPAGMSRGTRANAAGVDLMRNAPIDSPERVPPLVGGHRLSRRLPWYRGPAGDPLEPEAASLCATVERELLGRPFALAVDCHSGFGLRDRIWFPFAHRRSPISRVGELHALHEVFCQTHPHHPYVFEPQSRQYLTHGDLWDHLYLCAGDRPGQVFLPLTLEMGSWLWVKKNPRQLFSRAGMFNPVIAHRHERVLRRYLPLLDFAVRAAASHDQWLPRDDEGRHHQRAAQALWYGALR